MVGNMDKNMRTKPKAGASESKQSGYKISSAGDNIHRYFTEAEPSTYNRKKMQQGICPTEEVRSAKCQICNSHETPWQHIRILLLIIKKTNKQQKLEETLSGLKKKRHKDIIKNFQPA